MPGDTSESVLLATEGEGISRATLSPLALAIVWRNRCLVGFPRLRQCWYGLSQRPAEAILQQVASRFEKVQLQLAGAGGPWRASSPRARVRSSLLNVSNRLLLIKGMDSNRGC